MGRVLRMLLTAAMVMLFASCAAFAVTGILGVHLVFGPGFAAGTPSGAGARSYEVWVDGEGIKVFSSYDQASLYPNGLFAVLGLAAWIARGWLSARRHEVCRESRCCSACGYDLRATPDRCPECGAVPAPPHS